MSLLDIVYCYVSQTIPFKSDIDQLRNSFIANGFKEKQLDINTWKYTRGAGLAFEFNYNSEAIQMQVFLKRLNSDDLKIRVGNWGFPFEPLLMKKRFKKNLDRIVKEISTNGYLFSNQEEIKTIAQDAKKKKRLAIVMFFTVAGLLLVSKLIENL